MPDISKITLPSGNTYDLKDATARAAIEALEGASYFLGITTTNLTDGSHTSPILINGQPVSPKNGSITIHGESEFIWCGKNKYPLDIITMHVDAGKILLMRSGSGAELTVYVHETTTYEPLFVFSAGDTTSSASSAYVDLDPDWLYFKDNSNNYVKLLNSVADNCTYVVSGSSVYNNDCIWAQFGDLSTLGNLAYKDAVNVASSIVTTGHTVNVAVPANATTVSVGTSEIYPITGTASVISGVVATKKKLSTTSITGTNGTENVVKTLSSSSQKLAITGASVPLPGWSFTMGTGTGNTETLVISGGNNSGTPYTFNYATGGLTNSGNGGSVVTSVSAGSTADVAKVASSATTVATGSVVATTETTNVGATVAIDAAPSGSPTTVGTIASGTTKIKVGTIDSAVTVVTGFGSPATVLKSDATISNTVTYTDHS